MAELVEIFPFAFGVLLGLTWSRFGGPRARRVSWGVACILLGAFATFASGEWRESPLYFLFDIGLAAVVSVATTFAMALLQKSRTPQDLVGMSWSRHATQCDSTIFCNRAPS